MNCMKSLTAFAVIAVFGVATLQEAQAMPMQANSCTDGSVTATGRGSYDACIGPFAGNEGAMDGAVLLANINGGVFGGITGWVFDAKYDVDNNVVDEGPNNSNFQITGIPGNSGNWSISPATNDALVISLKTNTFWSAYYFAAGNLVSSGTWNTLGVSVNNGSGQDLSHGTISFFSNGGNPPAQTPEPGTLFLMGSGLAGLGLWRWKTKK